MRAGGESFRPHSAVLVVQSAPKGPVGRAAQAAVCKTAEKGAIPLRDSNFESPSIGVERYTPVFQTGIERALLSCSTIFRQGLSLASHFPQLNLICRQRPRTVEVMAGYWVQCAGEFSERSLKVRRLLREQE